MNFQNYSWNILVRYIISAVYFVNYIISAFSLALSGVSETVVWKVQYLIWAGYQTLVICKLIYWAFLYESLISMVFNWNLKCIRLNILVYLLVLRSLLALLFTSKFWCNFQRPQYKPAKWILTSWKAFWEYYNHVRSNILHILHHLHFGALAWIHYMGIHSKLLNVFEILMLKLIFLQLWYSLANNIYSDLSNNDLAGSIPEYFSGLLHLQRL